MWVLLSSRLRTWLAVAVAVPLARAVVHRAAAAAAGKDPDSPAAKLLHRADTALTAVAHRLTRRGRAGRR